MIDNEIEHGSIVVLISILMYSNDSIMVDSWQS